MQPTYEHSAKIAFCGWAAIFAFVVGYDSWALLTKNETLSGAFWRTKRKRTGRVLLGSAWLGLTWHLLFGDKQVLPQEIHLVYAKLHPLYRGRDFLVSRRG